MDDTTSPEGRDRMARRLSVIGQLTTVVAMTSTGVITGVLAQAAHEQDAHRAAPAAAPVAPATTAPAVLPRTKPVRTVHVTVPASGGSQRPRQAQRAPSRRLPRAAVPTRTVTAAPRPSARLTPPRPTSQPAATTSTGS